MARTKVFVSYSRQDSRWLARVREQLAVLVSEGLIELFEDTRITAGEDWYSRLNNEMLEARLALLLISPSFLTSSFIRKEEVPRLFAAHELKGMALYPLLIRDCPWREVSWLARLQIRPRDTRPIASLRGPARDTYLADVAREVASIVREESKVATKPVAPVNEEVDRTVAATLGDEAIRFLKAFAERGLDQKSAAFVAPYAGVTVNKARYLANKLKERGYLYETIVVAPPPVYGLTEAARAFLIEHRHIR